MTYSIHVHVCHSMRGLPGDEGERIGSGEDHEKSEAMASICIQYH